MIHVETQGAVDVIRVDGILNAEKISGLNDALDQINRAGAPLVVCDLAGVQLIDSEGLEWMLDAADEVALHGGTMKLTGATPLVADILRLTGISDQFEMFNSAREGVGSFSR